MNANELADELDYCYGKEYPCPVSKEAATMLRQQQAEIEVLKAENQALKLCETNYPLEKHSKEWFQQQLARSDKIIFMERNISSIKLDVYRKSKEQVKKKQEIIEQQQAEIEALKAENKFFKDIMGDVELLRKAQEK